MRHLKTLLTKKFVLMLFFAYFFCSTLSVMAADRFVDNGNGTITDTTTGLMWLATDNNALINWRGANEYCKNLNFGGYTDWRIPTLAELESIYNPDEKNKNGYHTTKQITTTAESCWSSETEGYKAGRFNFTYGKAYWLRQSFSGSGRVLPVRFNK
ncbi:MAG: hypothetical protein DRH93_16830 [Deltaproteobacteria bacterium]|nr:MAG: hypothetical protein DRH93_16830 [Deltaproteobacteria bacterium]